MNIILLVISIIALIILIVGVWMIYQLTGRIEKQKSFLKHNSDLINRIGHSSHDGLKSEGRPEIADNKKEWQKLAENSKNEELKLDYLVAAANRFPGEKDFAARLHDVLMPIAKGENTINHSGKVTDIKGASTDEKNNLSVRKEALMTLRGHANSFLDHCGIEDLPYALELKNSITAEMNALAMAIEENRRKKITQVLQEMESNIRKLQNNSSDTELLDKIEKADLNLDKELLDTFPDLKAFYNDLSDSLMQILGSSKKDSNAEIRKLNEKALKDGKEVLIILENSFKKGYKDFIPGSSKQIDADKLDLEEIARLLGGHDTRQLLHTTINFLRMAELEVFSKLSPESKILFTELMIRESTK